MNTREWALVAFTLMMQAAVGMLIAVVVVGGSVARTGPAGRPALQLPLGIAVAIGLVAMVVSMLHLGQPLNAWLAITNVRTSWLSREIVLSALFVAASISFLVTGTRTAGWLAAALGLAVVLAMARLYMVPAQPVWNSVLTPVNFFSTALLLGIVACLAIEGTLSHGPFDTTTIRTTAYLLVLLLAIQMVLVPAHLAAVPTDPAAAISLVPRNTATVIAMISAAASLAAIAILVRVLQASSLHANATTWLLAPTVSVALLLLAAVAAIAGRVLFYAAAVELRGP